MNIYFSFIRLKNVLNKLNMNELPEPIPNITNETWYDNDGPPLHTRIGFASAWVFIAVAGILGKHKLY